MNAVGMVIAAEAHPAAVFNREGYDIVDHYTYFAAMEISWKELQTKRLRLQVTWDEVS